MLHVIVGKPGGMVRVLRITLPARRRGVKTMDGCRAR